MFETATASIWNTPSAFLLARKIAGVPGLYCGPAAVSWIAAVWNAHNGSPYLFNDRVLDKSLFPDGPRSFVHTIPTFQPDLSSTLLRETNGQLCLSGERHYRYDSIHQRLKASEMPFIVRIPTASLRNGLHYVTLFKTILTNNEFRCYWQDNGVFKSDEIMQDGISVSVRSARRSPFFFWGARQVVKT